MGNFFVQICGLYDSHSNDFDLRVGIHITTHPHPALYRRTRPLFCFLSRTRLSSYSPQVSEGAGGPSMLAVSQQQLQALALPRSNPYPPILFIISIIALVPTCWFCSQVVQKEAAEERRKRIELQELVGTRDDEVISQAIDWPTSISLYNSHIISSLCRLCIHCCL